MKETDIHEERKAKMEEFGWQYEGVTMEKHSYSMDAGSFIDKINRDMEQALYDRRDAWWVAGGSK